MKPPTRAPLFACMYPGLCDIARARGYALAIHGTITADLDLVAIPWTDGAVSAEDLMHALMDHIGACGYEELLRRDGLPENQVHQIMARKESRQLSGAEAKPHARLSWNLYLHAGTKVDLSVMPLVSAPPVADGPAGFSDRERFNAIRENSWSVTYSGLYLCFIVQRPFQVVGNIGKGNTPEAAIDQAIRAARKGDSEVDQARGKPL